MATSDRLEPPDHSQHRVRNLVRGRDSGGGLGRLFVGPPVGLGSERSLRAQHMDHLRDSDSRPLRNEATRPLDGVALGARLFDDGVQLGVCELLYRGFAQLRLARNYQLSDVCRGCRVLSR